MLAFEKRIPLMLELGLSEADLPRLRSYVDLLWSANEELNLISRKMTFDELIDNHVIDCLLPLGQLPKQLQTAADFGAGGGLPGVIYAIHLSKTRYLLFEKSPKKQEFLNRCRAIAPNIEVHAEIPHRLDGVELVTARAFKPINVLLDISRDYAQSGGKYFLLKGRREKIDEEIAEASRQFKNLKTEIVPLHSPLLEVERHLVRI